MAKSQSGEKFTGLTYGGAPNIRACRESKDTFDLGDVEADTLRASITYKVPHAELCFYYPAFGTPHPECGDRFVMWSAKATQIDEECARLVETYVLKRQNDDPDDPDTPPDPEEPPPTQYSLRSSEFAEPIQLNEKFWDAKPGPPVMKGGTWVCDKENPGTVASWARGFVSDKREGFIPEGMALWTDGQERNAFPPCHPFFGVESYLESGAEFTTTEYDVRRPNESDISGGGSKLHTISNPVGLTGATSGKWLYTGFSSDFDGQWWSRSRTWRYNKNGWIKEIYED